MELDSLWEAASCAATQELPSILWNRKVHHRVHKSPILSQIDSIHINPSGLSKIHFNIVHTPTSWSPGGPFLTAFPLKCYMHSSSPHSCYMPCPSHPSWLDHSNYTWRSVQVMRLLTMQYFPTSCHFISLRSKYSPQHPVLKHPLSVPQNYWLFGLFPSSGILENSKQDVSETGSVSVLRWGGEDTYSDWH
jgi:hypothetical protein